MAATLTIAAPRRADVDENYTFEASEAGLAPALTPPQEIEVITPEGVDRFWFRSVIYGQGCDILGWEYRSLARFGPTLTLLND